MASAPDASLSSSSNCSSYPSSHTSWGLVTDRFGLTAVVGEFATGFVLGVAVVTSAMAPPLLQWSFGWVQSTGVGPAP
jgi:hypothetical protein